MTCDEQAAFAAYMRSLQTSLDTEPRLRRMYVEGRIGLQEFEERLMALLRARGRGA